MIGMIGCTIPNLGSLAMFCILIFDPVACAARQKHEQKDLAIVRIAKRIMLMRMVECSCGQEIPANEWEDGSCPKCGTPYSWERWSYGTGDEYEDVVIVCFHVEEKCPKLMREPI
jgi:hypothetical protein